MDDYAEGRPAKRRKTQPSRRKKTPASKGVARPFRFFDLPRELRDEIYDLLLDKHTTLKGRTYKIPDLRVFNGPRSSLLQVSRQFAYEYMEQMKRSTSLMITVNLAADFVRAKIPSVLASSCSRMVIETGAGTAGHVQEIGRSVEYLAHRYSNFANLRLVVYVSPSFRESLEPLTQCRSTSAIERRVIGYDFKFDAASVASWDREKGRDDKWRLIHGDPGE